MSKPLPTCCKPRQYHSPSGLAWFHARTCPEGRGQKIRNVFDPARAKRESDRLGEQEAETRSKGVVIPFPPTSTVKNLHPACIAAAADGASPCSECSWKMGLDNEGARWFQAKMDEAGY